MDGGAGFRYGSAAGIPEDEKAQQQSRDRWRRAALGRGLCLTRPGPELSQRGNQEVQDQEREHQHNESSGAVGSAQGRPGQQRPAENPADGFEPCPGSQPTVHPDQQRQSRRPGIAQEPQQRHFIGEIGHFRCQDAAALLHWRQESYRARQISFLMISDLPQAEESDNGNAKANQPEQRSGEPTPTELLVTLPSRPAPQHQRGQHQTERQQQQVGRPSSFIASKHSSQAGKARNIRHPANRRQRTFAIEQPLVRVRLELPFGKHHRRVDDRRGHTYVLWMIRGGGEF